MVRSYKFRLYPTKAQKAGLGEMLGTLCWLYNQALQERIEGWRNYGWNFTFFQQSAALKYLRARDERLRRFGSSVESRVLRRLDMAFQAFYRRRKEGLTVGYPRYRSASRFNTALFRFGDGIGLRGGRLYVMGVDGLIKVKMHRAVPSKPRAATIKREGSRWFLICHVEAEAPPASERPFDPVGVDAGLKSLVTLSTGEHVPTPQWTKAAAKGVRLRSRALSRAKLGSKRRRKARERLAAFHRSIARKRADFLHKLSRRIIDTHSHVAIEDLRVASLARSNLAKSINNAAWATLRNMLTYKAEDAGSVVVAVRPHGTSQICSRCEVDVPKARSVRIHDCPHCGLVLDRDLNAARNILARASFSPGLGRQNISEPVAA